MSGTEQPPGWTPPGGAPPPGAPPSPPPGFPPGPAVAGTPAGPPPAAPGFAAAAHRPGAMPLRPLTLGDIYDAAFKIIRFNPRATVGSAVLVGAVAMAIPVLATVILSLAIDVSFDPLTGTPGGLDSAFSATDLIALAATYGTLLLGALLQSLGLVFVTGMIAHVTAAAAIGRRLGLGQAWAATRGKRWRLLGLTVLLGLGMTAITGGYAGAWVVLALTDPPWTAYLGFGLLSAPVFLAAMVWFWIRCYLLSVPAFVLEPIGVFRAIGRGYRLSLGQFWRLFGIALLTAVVVMIAGNLLSAPISFAGQFGALALPPRLVIGAIIFSAALAQVIATAFTAPFTAAVTSLQYLDQRMRKEGYDVALMRQAGLTGPPAGPSAPGAP